MISAPLIGRSSKNFVKEYKLLDMQLIIYAFEK